MIVNPELLPDYKNDKLSILDIKLKLKSGETINIEIQVEPYKFMAERIVFYTSRMLSNQIVTGDDYKKLRNVSI